MNAVVARVAGAVRAVAGWPIVIRDLRAAQRNPRVLGATIGAVVVLSVAIAIGVLAVASGGGADPEFLGQVLVQIVYWAAVLVVVGVFPGLASVPLVAERERRSLDLVHMSQLSPLAIAVGTMGASLVNGGVMLVALLPPLTLALVFGGVPWWIVAEMVWLVALAGALAAALGVHASAVSRTTVRAVLQGYLAALLLPGGFCAVGGGMFALFLDMQARGMWEPAVQTASVLMLGAATVTGGAFGLLALLLARNALLPPGGNRATVLRWFMLGLTGFWAFAGVWLLVDLPRRFGVGAGAFDHEVWRGWGTAVLLLLWLAALAMVMAFATEDPAGRRVEHAAARFRGWRAPGRCWYPGAERGACFALSLAAVALLGPAAIADAFEAAGGLGGPMVSADFRSGGVLTLMALGLWCQLVAVAGVGVCARRLLGTAARARQVLAAAFVALQVLAHVGVGWSYGAVGAVELSMWDGSLVAVWTLCHGAWAPAGECDSLLDPTLAGTVVPFPLLFAAVHLAAGVVLLGLAGWPRAARAAPVPAPA